MVCDQNDAFLPRAGLALALLLALVVPTPGSADVATSAGGRVNAWTVPHVLTISDGADLSTLNPHVGQSAPTANLSEMTMAWLVKWDEHNRPYPEL